MKRVALVSMITILLVAWMAVFNILMGGVQDKSLRALSAQIASGKYLPLDPALIAAGHEIYSYAMDAQTGPSKPDPELIAKGRNIFEFTAGGVGCASCHGHFALGDVNIGPNIRGVDEKRIRGALASVEVMQFLVPQLTDDDIKAVAAYLQYLGTLTPAKSVRKKGVFNPSELHLPIATQAQLIISNTDRTPCTFTSPKADFEDKLVDGRKVEDIIWTTPDSPASSTASCKETPDQLLTLVIEKPASVQTGSAKAP